MPALGPIKRRELIHNLTILGFAGPYSGRKHRFMIKGEIILRLPNPHKSDIGKEFLSRILKQATIDKKTWEGL